MSTRRVVTVAMALVVLVLAAALGLRYWPGGTPDSPDTSLTGSPPASAPPVPVPAGGSYVQTQVLASGDLLVSQWIESSKSIFEIRLRVPQDTGLDGAVATDVRVQADGRVATGPDQLARRPGRYSFLGARSVHISYRLSGVVERSSSVPGRALARITTLETTYRPASDRTVHTVTAPEMLSLACSSSERGAEPAPCGSPSADGGWSVELVGRRAVDRVVAQLSLD